MKLALAACVSAALGVLLTAPANARLAYVTKDPSSVAVFDTATNAKVGADIVVGSNPNAIAITPDGTRAYVVNQGPPASVSAITTATNTVTPIAVGTAPRDIAITPDGTRAYVANSGSANVSVIDTATNVVIATIPVGVDPAGVAITPDGTRAYVARQITGVVVTIDTATNTVVGAPIPVPSDPVDIAITPNGARAYVTNSGSSSVSAIDLASNTVVGMPIAVGNAPVGVAITPDGTRAYVVHQNSMDVRVIATATDSVVGSPIAIGTALHGIAITPDGTRAYISTGLPGQVAIVNTVTDTPFGTPIDVGPTISTNGPAITPDQPPTAAFTTVPAPAGLPTTFDASGSTDADGTIARYDWDFGDGTVLPDGGPNPAHAYAAAGANPVTLNVTDNEGCSTSQVFTGHTMSCNGSSAARSTQEVTIADADPPGLTLSGPRNQTLDGAVEVGAICDEACAANGEGKLVIIPPSSGGKSGAKRQTFKLKRQTKQLGAGQRATLKLKLSNRARRAATAALTNGGKVTARISVSAADGAGNAANAGRSVGLRQRRR